MCGECEYTQWNNLISVHLVLRKTSTHWDQWRQCQFQCPQGRFSLCTTGGESVGKRVRADKAKGGGATPDFTPSGQSEENFDLS